MCLDHIKEAKRKQMEEDEAKTKLTNGRPSGKT